MHHVVSQLVALANAHAVTGAEAQSTAKISPAGSDSSLGVSQGMRASASGRCDSGSRLLLAAGFPPKWNAGGVATHLEKVLAGCGLQVERLWQHWQHAGDGISAGDNDGDTVTAGDRVMAATGQLPQGQRTANTQLHVMEPQKVSWPCHEPLHLLHKSIQTSLTL